MTEPSDGLTEEDIRIGVELMRAQIRYGNYDAAVYTGSGLLASMSLDVITRLTIQTTVGITYGLAGKPAEALSQLEEAFALACGLPESDVELILIAGHSTLRSYLGLGNQKAAQATLRRIEAALMPSPTSHLLTSEQLAQHRQFVNEVQHLL